MRSRLMSKCDNIFTRVGTSEVMNQYMERGLMLQRPLAVSGSLQGGANVAAELVCQIVKSLFFSATSLKKTILFLT